MALAADILCRYDGRDINQGRHAHLPLALLRSRSQASVIADAAEAIKIAFAAGAIRRPCVMTSRREPTNDALDAY